METPRRLKRAAFPDSTCSAAGSFGKIIQRQRERKQHQQPSRFPRPAAAKRRPRFTRKSFAYSPAKTRKYEAHGRLAARLAMGDKPPLNGPVCLTATVELTIPASWSKRRRALAIARRICPTTRPDADNFLKSAMDATTGIVVADDSLVVKVTIEKKFGVDPDFGPGPGQAAPHVTCPTNKSRATKQLEILALRSLELADQVAAGQLELTMRSTSHMRPLFGAAWSKLLAMTSYRRRSRLPLLMREGQRDRPL